MGNCKSKQEQEQTCLYDKCNNRTLDFTNPFCIKHKCVYCRSSRINDTTEVCIQHKCTACNNHICFFRDNNKKEFATYSDYPTAFCFKHYQEYCNKSTESLDNATNDDIQTTK
jgi:hypothetical protein